MSKKKIKDSSQEYVHTSALAKSTHVFNFSRYFKQILEVREIGVIIALISIALFFSLTTSVFLTWRNFFNIVRQASVIGIIAVGMTILIISQEFDLSVGSILAVTAMTSGLMIKHTHMNIWLTIPLGLGLGAMMGLINGFITIKGHIPSFIATLGMMMFYRGIAFVLSKGMPIALYKPSSFYILLGQGRLFGLIPAPAIWLVVVCLVGYFFLHHTKYGFEVYATGGNEEAARLCGINTKKIKLISFIITGMAAAFAGLVSVAYLGSVTPRQGMGIELEAIAASVIGGASLLGGEGSILGAFLGAFIMAEIRNGLVIKGVGVYWQDALLGLVIVIAVLLTTQIQRRRAIES